MHQPTNAQHLARVQILVNCTKNNITADEQNPVLRYFSIISNLGGWFQILVLCSPFKKFGGKIRFPLWRAHTFQMGWLVKNYQPEMDPSQLSTQTEILQALSLALEAVRMETNEGGDVKVPVVIVLMGCGWLWNVVFVDCCLEVVYTYIIILYYFHMYIWMYLSKKSGVFTYNCIYIYTLFWHDLSFRSNPLLYAWITWVFGRSAPQWMDIDYCKHRQWKQVSWEKIGISIRTHCSPWFWMRSFKILCN